MWSSSVYREGDGKIDLRTNASNESLSEKTGQANFGTT